MSWFESGNLLAIWLAADLSWSLGLDLGAPLRFKRRLRILFVESGGYRGKGPLTKTSHGFFKLR